MSLDHVVFVVSTALVFALATAAWSLTAVRSQRHERLVHRLALHPSVAVAASSGPGLGRAVARRLKPFAFLATPAAEEERSRVRLRLAAAGFRRDETVSAFLGGKVLLAFTALLAFAWLNAKLARPLPNPLLLGVLASGTAFYAPNLWLSGRVKARRRSIERALPDALDLLVTCVEAGLALDGAVLRVAGELRLAHRVVSEELELTHLEIKAGMPRVEAFRRLAERTGVDDLKQLAATLTQTELFGTRVGVALRVQSEGMRVRRMQRAEERAAMVAVKMTLPLVFCILPSLFAVIIGPGVLNIMQQLMPHLGGK